MNEELNMRGLDILNKTREYLDYLEEHLINVSKAHSIVTGACGDLLTEPQLTRLKIEVELHDTSKFSKHELTQYRAKFYPADGEVPIEDEFDLAWEHHYTNNHHHWETLKDEVDLFHMVIDWLAMSLKFGGSPMEYYEKNKEKINVDPRYLPTLHLIFDRLRKR